MFEVQNPLQFRLPPEVDEESLMQGAEQLSAAILESGVSAFMSRFCPAQTCDILQIMK